MTLESARDCGGGGVKWGGMGERGRGITEISQESILEEETFILLVCFRFINTELMEKKRFEINMKE